jgi:hypothetical protein
MTESVTPGAPGVLWCWPGPKAKATFVHEDDGQPLLVIHCDPFNLLLMIPPGPAGPTMMAGYLRGLASASQEMADRIDPTGPMQPSSADRSAAGTGEAGDE